MTFSPFLPQYHDHNITISPFSVESVQVSTSQTYITATAVAPPLFRASPIDPALRDPSDSQPSDRVDSDKENGAGKVQASQENNTNNLTATLGRDISRPSSAASTQSSINHLIHPNGSDIRGVNGHANGGAHPSQSISLNNTRQSLPGLSTLASIASAPTSSLRYAFLR